MSDPQTLRTATINMKTRITIDLSSHPEVYERIQQSAATESRSMAGQLLHEALPALLQPSVRIAALLKRKAPKKGVAK
jgi:hypothetical protein